MKTIVSFWILFLLTIVSAASAKERKFYLTQGTFTGSQALTACAVDYHMASLWEIFEFSNLKYDTTLGLTPEDSYLSSGPPRGEFGFIRTGPSSSTSAISGEDNCDLWTNGTSAERGSVVMLTSAWDSATVSPTDPWFSRTLPCDADVRVWCVQN